MFVIKCTDNGPSRTERSSAVIRSNDLVRKLSAGIRDLKVSVVVRLSKE